MTVNELSQDQLEELMGNYLIELQNEGRDIEDVSMSEVIKFHEGTDFVNDDFFCSRDED